MVNIEEKSARRKSQKACNDADESIAYYKIYNLLW